MDHDILVFPDMQYNCIESLIFPGEYCCEYFRKHADLCNKHIKQFYIFRTRCALKQLVMVKAKYVTSLLVNDFLFYIKFRN